MMGFIPCTPHVAMRAKADCDAEGDGGVTKRILAGTELVWTMTHYDGRYVLYDPRDRYHDPTASIPIEKSLVIAPTHLERFERLGARKLYVLKQEVRAQIDLDSRRTALLQIYEEVALVATLPDQNVCLVEVKEGLVRVSRNDLEESLIPEKVAV